MNASQSIGMDLENRQFPIGPFRDQESYSPEERDVHRQIMERLPFYLRRLVENLTDEQLETPYRPGGWSIRQVVHHLADSHMNGYIRFKLALTENSPEIRPYHQDPWSFLSDVKASIEPSLILLEGLHRRWDTLIRNMEEGDFSRSYYHPEDQQYHNLASSLAQYAWHTRHHCGHIEWALKDLDIKMDDLPHQVTGLGGVFFMSPDPEKLKSWYKEHLGINYDQYGFLFKWRNNQEVSKKGYTQWSVFSNTSKYFQPSDQRYMINYRVKDLEGLLESLREKGIELPGEMEVYEYGKFAWLIDLDGNKVELWEPGSYEF